MEKPYAKGYEGSMQPHQLTRYLHSTRRLRVENPTFWDHHRGGWQHVVNLITENLHAPDGTRFVSAVEDELHYKGSIKEPWVGFIHQVPYQQLGFPDLERLIRRKEWKESLVHCRGLWVLCDYYKRFLQDNFITVPISKVYYPSQQPVKKFSFSRFTRNTRKKLIFIGEFLRNYQPFYDLQAPGYEKVLLKHRFLESHFRKQFVQVNDSVRIQDFVSNQEYDNALSQNIVFLNLLDAGANTTVIECIVSGTPILINNVGAVSEYLGKNYPFYYANLNEAMCKLNDQSLIRETAQYLKELEIKKYLTDDYFLNSIQNTAIYRMLPVPKNQQAEFKSYDVSVIICSYKRVYNLRRLLTLMSEQDFNGSFEIIFWNNNIEAASEVNSICREFEEQLSLKVIHSSENFYCIVRMALPALIRSDLLLICDDDVLPQKSYISTFIEKYKQYGPEAVLCARGHIFLPHTLDEDNPEKFWASGEAMRFYDESKSDIQLHFLHADNALIPKTIMKRAAQYEMERYEYGLVDDYWLSYILSHHLKIPIWKIKSDHILSLTDCSDDPNIALFHNSRVNEQRVNFYLYHMKQGWPPFHKSSIW